MCQRCARIPILLPGAYDLCPGPISSVSPAAAFLARYVNLSSVISTLVQTWRSTWCSAWYSALVSFPGLLSWLSVFASLWKVFSVIPGTRHPCLGVFPLWVFWYRAGTKLIPFSFLLFGGRSVHHCRIRFLVVVFLGSYGEATLGTSVLVRAFPQFPSHHIGAASFALHCRLLIKKAPLPGALSYAIILSPAGGLCILYCNSSYLLLQSAIFLATMILTINLVACSLKTESVCFPSSKAD